MKLLDLCLKISYKNHSPSGSAEAKAQRKREVQILLKSNLGITVDKPKQGYGTSNTGNIARKFFKNHELVSDILGIDRELMADIAGLIQIISS